MSLLTRNDVVILAEECLADEDIFGPLDFNVRVVNSLNWALLKPSEISYDAQLSYYVEYYLSRLDVGGFSQLLRDSDWKPFVRTMIKDGLRKMGAHRHLELFLQFEALVESGKLEREQDSAGKKFDQKRHDKKIDLLTDQFFEICESESLEHINLNWLKNRPDLLVIPWSQINDEIKRRTSLIGDIELRRARAENTPCKRLQYFQELAKIAGVTILGKHYSGFIGDPEYYGRGRVSWKVETDQGPVLIGFSGRRAVMFVYQTDDLIAELDTDPDFLYRD